MLLRAEGVLSTGVCDAVEHTWENSDGQVFLHKNAGNSNVQMCRIVHITTKIILFMPFIIFVDKNVMHCCSLTWFSLSADDMNETMNPSFFQPHTSIPEFNNPFPVQVMPYCCC